MTAELTNLSAIEARRRLDRREVSAVELTEAHLERIERLEPHLHAFITVMADVARAQAREADRRIAAGEATALTGIPVALKDILCTVDAPTTAASKILRNYQSPYDATVVRRLREQGAVFVGKTNTDEFAMGSSTENSAFFVTRNPWDLNRVPGGSSGGSAAAVAAGEAILALGSDTGGSIRQPAGFCGVVGVKPTYGRVSRYGLLAFASSLDQIGPFARSVADAAVLLEAISGRDPNDSTSVDLPVPSYVDALGQDIRGMRIGIAREYQVEGVDPEVERVVQAAITELERLGAELVEVSLPHTSYALATYYIIAPAEASANLARYDGVKYGLSIQEDTLLEDYLQTRGQGFGPEVKRRIMLGTYALSSGYYDAYYVKAQKVRTLIKRDFDEAFEKVDVIAGPTSPTVAFGIGERVDDPIQMYLADIFTIPANMAGIPGVAIPCGFAHGMPVSLQLLGRAFDEATVLRVAHAYEQAAGWSERRPPLDMARADASGDTK
ncbi:Asp-tRNA(Asn)/Glu-tRNA(Gln) amidotransferase subunit GatA [Sphaerobacter thermophilus]|uniref:Glutamyl-tRNA(Gln) amidotransferase subunit A n=1 Tax=Sphaerobacter thermophilus (strain ATCC 49802 / DSM 20745 / KCCM 41009 / NCIMB 13125 / S 6022) TaxID=479434 RepID=D1C542_SPHTD|nr:Asp-tRNA(Asn)/Glu-tRNA(Gln) amidotransferase subunit GatA [Sphaerobacter thermophilus]ACZ39359.1 glutamyl-tRNA(Gln) amidotransferase, A subunit [Sphaerobacter thermophilus DSM 20745]